MSLFRSPLAPVPGHIPAQRVYDFDVFYDPGETPNGHEAYLKLHRDAPDVFWTPRHGGHWIATRYDDVRKIGITPEIFSSANAHADRGVNIPMPPIDMDPPEHMKHRLLLLKFLSPQNLREQEPFVRRLTVELIEGFKTRNACDFRDEFAVVLPVTVFLTLMQWDISRLRQFVDWVYALVGSPDPAVRGPAFLAVSQFIDEMVQARLANPGNDPLSILLQSEIDGERVTPQRVKDMANLLFMAGLDTVTNGMTWVMKHLAENLDDQEYLRGHPDKIAAAVDELLRRYSFAIAERRITRDTELGGAFLKAGDRLVLGLPAASNDERHAGNPEKVDFGRERCPHVAFSTGAHTCVGRPLALVELRVMLEEWLSRLPPFKLAPNFKMVPHGGPVMGMERLDLAW